MCDSQCYLHVYFQCYGWLVFLCVQYVLRLNLEGVIACLQYFNSYYNYDFKNVCE